jgi:hypothetical protein
MLLAGAAALGLLWWVAAEHPSPGQVFGRFSVKRFAAACTSSYLLACAVYCLALPRQDLKLRLARCALATFAILLLWVPVEILVAANVLDFRNLFSPPESIQFTRIKPWQNPANRLDPELLHIHRPNQRVTGQTVGDLVHWFGIATDRKYEIDLRYDSRGFRNDREFSRAPVVIIGDSFAEAGLVQGDELLPTRLSESLGVGVANLGQSGYGPQQELTVLQRYGLPLQPKLVLWLFFEGNDLLDFPRYEKTIASWGGGAPGVPFIERSFSKNLLLALARLTEPRMTMDSDLARRRSGLFTRARDDAHKLYFAYPGAPLAEQDLDSLKKTQQLLLEARRGAADAGATFLLLFVPTKFRVYGELCQFEEDADPAHWTCNDLPQRLAGWSRAQSVPYLNLTTALKAAAADGELVFFTDDGHWNGKGNEVAARAVSQFIQDQALLPAPALTARSAMSPPR